jgi:hypothetical protein
MKVKDSDYWNSPMEETRNQSGFSALPGGYRENSGNFLDRAY